MGMRVPNLLSAEIPTAEIPTAEIPTYLCGHDVQVAVGADADPGQNVHTYLEGQGHHAHQEAQLLLVTNRLDLNLNDRFLIN